MTVKVIKKRQKHKSKGSVRTIEKKVKADSFFNFFDPPVVPTPDGKDVPREKDGSPFLSCRSFRLSSLANAIFASFISLLVTLSA